ncbi:MAG: SDR family NAD(P)-dependent oxidoreductase [Bacteroidales bacterium]|nr:SDR family NAD(P)-dependent oxidoreductase [Bacteroidales bacterium]
MSAKVIVTGASGAMGSAAVRALASRGESIVMACRDLHKAAAVRDRILEEFPGAEIELRQLDLSSLASVRRFAESSGLESVSALFNNAGVISRKYFRTGDGLENTFAVNYFAPFLLTRLLLPRMEEDARIVNMVSLTCRYVEVGEASLQPGPEEFSQLGTYARSKLALMRFSMELSRRYPQLRVGLADPGIVNSNMISLGQWFDPLADRLFRPFCKSPENGVKPALSALGADRPGLLFYKGNRCRELSRHYLDPGLDLRLWNETERILGEN